MTDTAISCADCQDHGWTLTDRSIELCECGAYDPPKWVQRGDQPCILDHYKHPERPRRAHAGLLCSGHFARLEQHIAELPATYDELGTALTSSEKPNNDGGHAKNSQVAGGVNLNPKVVEAREELHAECWRMAHTIRDATGADLPATDTISAVSTWLLNRLTWIAEQDPTDWYLNLDRLTRHCTSLVSPSGRQKIDLTKRTGHACQTITTCDVTTRGNVRCGGPLHAIITGGGWAGDEGRLYCGQCGQERPITLVALADFEGAA